MGQAAAGPSCEPAWKSGGNPAARRIVGKGLPTYESSRTDFVGRESLPADPPSNCLCFDRRRTPLLASSTTSPTDRVGRLTRGLCGYLECGGRRRVYPFRVGWEMLSKPEIAQDEQDDDDQADDVDDAVHEIAFCVG
jgi:hypothetical protein